MTSGLRSRSQYEEPTREHGVVHWFNREQGFGLITPDDGGADVFVHFSEIAGDGFGTLHDGEVVVYEIDRTDQPPQARNVHPLGAQAQSRHTA
ncbi:cold-shock protein [Rhodococcus sp. 21391]|nr:cold-shock protein [Rhodococcus sp. 21391]QQZ12666.1 cold-shock protein [Rhodococcus sp. 21391]QQZ17249.1 cold-shock protein [Rhodococcus sp. 21391]